MNHLKTFEQYNYNSENQLNENWVDWLKGVNWYKKYWKVVYGYYKNMNKPDMSKKVAQFAKVMQENNWPNALSKVFRPFDELAQYMDAVKIRITGATGFSTSGSISRGGTNDPATLAAEKAMKDFQKNPAIWDADIVKDQQ